ncbi:unnamed protein product [Cercopithifilaria johnstoni]|uniref:TATA element modulatory factor 1 TATA binding domain-containing protein n=1 Tax=Cercopithifilaria johnstoni TaxID=2874296 RepID=A0A8J2M2Q8_9BILA|nr:unnamed protein product [Cercopithifilaria johnstoni]
MQRDLVTIERLNEHVRRIEQQNSIKLLQRIEELTKTLSEKEDEIGTIYVQLNNEANAFEKRIMEKQCEVDDARKYCEVLEKELHKSNIQSPESLMEQERVQDYLPDGGSFMLSVPNYAVQVELADALAKYDQSMRQISTLEEKISIMEAESQCLGSLRHELQALRLRYENLLEAHGEKIERIEELELDLADVKKLLKDQVTSKFYFELVSRALRRDQQGIVSSAQGRPTGNRFECSNTFLFGKFGGKIQIYTTSNSHHDKYMSEDSRNSRKLRVRGRAQEGNNGFTRGRTKDIDISTTTSDTPIESGGAGKRTRRKSFPDAQDLRKQSEIGEGCCEPEQPARSSKRLKKSGFDSARLLVPSDELSKSQMHEGKVGHNCEDDAVDVVSNNDDPLTELDVESSGKKATSGFENRRKDELGESYQQYILNQAQKGISPTRRDIFIDDDIRYGYDGSSGSGISSMLRLDRKPVPATAPLLTTERTHVRVAKRKNDEAAKHRERRLQERELLQKDGRGRSARVNRYYYEEEKPMLDDVDDVMYAEIGLGDNDFIETSFEEEELIYAADSDLVAASATEEGGNCDNAMPTECMRSESIQETQEEDRTLPKQEDMIEQVNDDVESNDDEAPPELEPQSPTLQKVVRRPSANKHDDATNFGDGEMQVICVQTPNGTEQFIQLAPGQTLSDDNALFMSESDNVEANVRHDLRAVEFSFLDSKNICCGLCGEIVLYDLLLSSHIPQHHPEVLEEGVTAFEDVPYETWLREKLSEEKRRMENSVCNIYDDLSSSHNSSRIYRSVSTIRVNPNEMSLNQLITALRKKMFEKLGRAVPVTLVDKQHARCGICNAVVSLNRKFEVVHLVRHFNAWHPSVHQCAGKWKLKKPQPGLGKPLSIQDFAVIDTSLDRGANLQCIWCGMFMAAEALAMHFSEVHPEEVEVPKCNLCLQELVINARLLEKYGDEFDVSMPDEHRIRCGKYGTMHTSEARLNAAIEKRLKLCEEGKNANDIEDDEMDEERATSYVNSRMTFGRRSKPKRQFIMPALRQAAPVNSRYVEAVNDCHWKCKMCNGDILAAVISAGAIRHFRTEHPHHLHNMQYELCRTRLERISDGCMEFINPQLIECLVCNMTYMLHRPFNMCRAIRHLRSKHPDLMPEFASTADAGNNLQRNRMVRGQELSEGMITDPATIATLKAQYGVDFKKVQALKGANGEPVYVLLDEGDEIDPETASQLAASVAAGDFDRAKPEIRHTKSTTGPAAGATATTVDISDRNAVSARPTSEKIPRGQQQKQVKSGPTKNIGSSNFEIGPVNKKLDEPTEPFIIASD